MTSASATSPDGDIEADQRPITIRTWLAMDLLRVLDELRFGQHGRVPTALRDDLDYHAGLLRVRVHRTIHHAPRPHSKENHDR